MIRLFFRIHDQNSIGGNAVRVNLKFDDPLNVSGQLRYYNSGTVALNQQTKVIEASTISFLSPYSLSWASVDFVMAYDPCVCSHPSKLKFEFEKISTSSKVIPVIN